MFGEVDFVDVSQAIEELGYHYLVLLIDAKEGFIELAIQFNKIADEDKAYFLSDEYVFSENERQQAINRLVDFVIFEPSMIENIIQYINYCDGVFFLDGKKITSALCDHMFVYEKGLRRSIWGGFELDRRRAFRLYITKKQYEIMKKNKEESDFCNHLEKEGHTLASLYRQLNNNETQKRQIDRKQLREWQERAAIEDGKPTAEQLQQQLDAANKRISELEAMQEQKAEQVQQQLDAANKRISELEAMQEQKAEQVSNAGIGNMKKAIHLLCKNLADKKVTMNSIAEVLCITQNGSIHKVIQEANKEGGELMKSV